MGHAMERGMGVYILCVIPKGNDIQAENITSGRRAYGKMQEQDEDMI